MTSIAFPFTIANDMWCCGMPECSKQISSIKKSLIVYHRNTHYPKYSCETCGDSFPQKSRLEVHIRTTHTGEKPYSCNVCKSTFAQLSNLNDHTKKKHVA